MVFRLPDKTKGESFAEICYSPLHEDGAPRLNLINAAKVDQFRLSGSAAGAANRKSQVIAAYWLDICPSDSGNAEALRHAAVIITII